MLNREIFLSFEEACWVIDRWRLDYNHHRIHSSTAYIVHWITRPLPHMRRAVFFRLRLRLSLQNTVALLTPILSLNLGQRPGGSQQVLPTKRTLPITAPPCRSVPSRGVLHAGCSQSCFTHCGV
ncbi:MAG: hypothetical protein CMM07_25105 [Rhodopirellula sp.]|nr:hypothetical protein [Rhodopirellula sp.]